MSVKQAKKASLQRIVDATSYSFKGLRYAWQNEQAFREECVLAVLFIPLAFIMGESGVEKVLLFGSCLLVLIAELLNSAIEAVVDRVGTEYHPLAGSAKDLGSAAVFVSLFMFIVTWVLLLV